VAGVGWRDDAKKRAALEAVTLVAEGQVVGLGTGSTAYYAIEELGRRIREDGLNVRGISTSEESTSLAERFGVPLTSLNKHPRVDVAIDGADQVDGELNLIKGMGGALTREKIVDSTARSFIVIVDRTKVTKRLGVGQVVPVEVLPFATEVVMQRVRALGGDPRLRRVTETTPFVTDNGHYVLDVDFGAIEDGEALEKAVKMLPGVIEVGLFIKLAHIVFVGYEVGVEKRVRRDGN
jgi:ribose 5-phosphate isomerase A